MIAKRSVLGFSILLMVVASLLLAYFKVSFRPVSRSEAEKEIYSALITGNHVFEEHTTLADVEISEAVFQYIMDEAPVVKMDTLSDFQKSNSQAYLLKDYLPANTSFVFLSDADIQKFYNNWEDFASQYPNVQLINAFSRIGFNSTSSQAIVLKSSSAKIFDAPFDYSGNGTIYVFKRIGGRWFKQYEIVVSITG